MLIGWGRGNRNILGRRVFLLLTSALYDAYCDAQKDSEWGSIATEITDKQEILLELPTNDDLCTRFYRQARYLRTASAKVGVVTVFQLLLGDLRPRAYSRMVLATPCGLGDLECGLGDLECGLGNLKVWSDLSLSYASYYREVYLGFRLHMLCKLREKYMYFNVGSNNIQLQMKF